MAHVAEHGGEARQKGLGLFDVVGVYGPEAEQHVEDGRALERRARARSREMRPIGVAGLAAASAMFNGIELLARRS